MKLYWNCIEINMNCIEICMKNNKKNNEKLYEIIWNYMELYGKKQWKLYENSIKMIWNDMKIIWKNLRDAKIVVMRVILLTMIGITLTTLIFYCGFLNYLRI